MCFREAKSSSSSLVARIEILIHSIYMLHCQCLIGSVLYTKEYEQLSGTEVPEQCFLQQVVVLCCSDIKATDCNFWHFCFQIVERPVTKASLRSFV